MENIARDVKQEIVSHLSAQEILNMCSVSKEFSNICKEEGLWKKLIERDYFPLASITKIPEETWKSLYLELDKKKYFLSLTEQGKRYLHTVERKNFTTIEELLDKIPKMFHVIRFKALQESLDFQKASPQLRNDRIIRLADDLLHFVKLAIQHGYMNVFSDEYIRQYMYVSYR